MSTGLLDQTISRYRIEEVLGAGGMGTVYAARVVADGPDVSIGDRVALKVIHPHVLLLRPEARRRLDLELSLGARVRHDNVVHTFDSTPLVVDGFDSVALVMEYVEGCTLRELLRKRESLSEETCRHVGLQVARGLAAIHAAGAMHRDLKPENVICTVDEAGIAACVRDGRSWGVKIMDLGVARLLGDQAHHSVPGAFVGSLDYAAPEQFADGGTHVDHRLDLYALGLLLYEIATGGRPFHAGDIAGLIACTLRELPPRLSSVAPHLSPFFDEFVHTLLHKDPRLRFADAATVVHVLHEAETSRWWERRSET